MRWRPPVPRENTFLSPISIHVADKAPIFTSDRHAGQFDYTRCTAVDAHFRTDAHDNRPRVLAFLIAFRSATIARHPSHHWIIRVFAIMRFFYQMFHSDALFIHNWLWVPSSFDLPDRTSAISIKALFSYREIASSILLLDSGSFIEITRHLGKPIPPRVQEASQSEEAIVQRRWQGGGAKTRRRMHRAR